MLGAACPVLQRGRRCARWAARLLAAGVAVALSTGASGAAAMAPGDIAIELPEIAEVGQPQVRFGDIAIVRTSDLQSQRRLVSLPLGRAPRPGVPVVLDRAVLSKWILQQTGWGSGFQQRTIHWSGAMEVQVLAAAQVLSSKRVSAVAEAALKQWLDARSTKAHVEPLSRVPDQALASGELTLRARPLPPQGAPARRMSVWVDVFANDRFVKAIPVSFAVEAWVPVRVALRSLAEGEIVERSDLQVQLVERSVNATDLRPAALSAPYLAEGSDLPRSVRLRHAVRAGEVLSRSDLEAAPDVVRGNRAELSAVAGAVALTGQAEVLQDGRVGETVRVRLPGATGTILARVTGPDQVEAFP